MDGNGRGPSSDRLLAVIALQNALVCARQDIDEVLHVVAARVVTLLPGDGAVVEVLDGDELCVRAVAGNASGMKDTRVRRDASLSGRCVESRSPQRCDDAAHDDRVDREHSARAGASSIACAPLLHGGTVLGVLKVWAVKPAAFSDGDTHLLALLADVAASALVNAKQAAELQRATLHDHLTGLLNRRAFDERLAQELERRRRYSDPLALALANLDGFKAMNDELGHTAGDEALREVAALLRGCIRSIDAAFRLGGDEFAVVFPNTDVAGARAPIQRFVEAVSRARLGGGRVRVSVGLVEATGESVADLIALADAALHAERRSRDRE